MANHVRFSKSGSNWTLNDLNSYNIHLESQETQEFFGVLVLPDPVVDPEILQHLEANDKQAEHNAEFINLLDLAMLRKSGESAVDDFAVNLYRLIGYTRRNQVARSQNDLPLLICGERRHAKTDVCIVNRCQNDTILLVQEDKRLQDIRPSVACAQLVAEALAAFTENNASRESSNLPPLESEVMPGIVMIGTTPTFFKVPVTEELVAHVQRGTYPSTTTVVTYCLPSLPCPAHHLNDGMKPLCNRCHILSCYEAFKTCIGI